MISSKKSSHQDPSEKKPVIFVTPLVKNLCSVFEEKGRYHSTASKLQKTQLKCIRMGR